MQTCLSGILVTRSIDHVHLDEISRKTNCPLSVNRLTLSLPNLAKSRFRPNFQILFCEILKKKIAPCESTGREVSFEWSHPRISSADSKVRVTLQNSIKHSGSERVNQQETLTCEFIIQFSVKHELPDYCVNLKKLSGIDS